MKILLSLGLVEENLALPIAADPVLAKALGPVPNQTFGFLFKKFFDASGPVLPRLLKVCEGESISFLRHMEFSGAELDAATHLEVLCRATIAQTEPDSNRMSADYDAATLQPGPSRWRVRLPARVFLSKPVPPDKISHVDQWTGEYAVGEQAVRGLESSGFTGLELLPLFHGRTGKPQPQGRHLSTRHLLPAALEDGTTFETPDYADGQRTPRRYGLMSYAPRALDGSPDLARTAEPWGDWCTPDWVVRQSVRQWFKQAGLKGWAFSPVLVAGDRMHEEHTRLWAGTLDQLAAHGQAKIAA